MARLLLPKDIRTVKKKTEAYFKEREKSNKPKTFHGLCREVGLDYDLFVEIGDVKTKEEVQKLAKEHGIKPDIIKYLKGAYLEIMEDYEVALRGGGGKSSGAIFAMKVHGWKDGAETEKERELVINLINYATGKTKQITKGEIIKKKPKLLKDVRPPKSKSVTHKTI